MSKILFEETGIEGMKLVHPFEVRDSRGAFIKSYERDEFLKNGIALVPYEENESVSVKGTIRGLHFQKCFCQDKLVRVIKGEVFDVGVDLRRNSPTFGMWKGYRLSDANRLQLYIPKGFAHGFMALANNTVIHYLAGDKYDPQSDGGIRWNDPDIGVDWPLDEADVPTISQKDTALPSLSEFKASFGGFEF